MRRSMRSPTKQDGTDRRKTERRGSATVESANGERRVVEQRGVVTSMVDALEDILKWERASERVMRVASEQSVTELDPAN
jgi:hypothetical protein